MQSGLYDGISQRNRNVEGRSIPSSGKVTEWESNQHIKEVEENVSPRLNTGIVGIYLLQVPPHF